MKTVFRFVVALTVVIALSSCEKPQVVTPDANDSYLHPSDWNVYELEELDLEAVDLGLSVLWASKNIGAARPESVGDYYSFGSVTFPSDLDFSDANYIWTSGGKFTKYNDDPAKGTVDNKTKLDDADDVAQVVLKNGWRIPTKQEYEELMSGCTWQRMQVYGVNCYKVTGKNGRYIILPAAGCYQGKTYANYNSYGQYWTSTVSGNKGEYFGFDYKSQFFVYNIRANGQTVRPVKAK